MGNHGQGAAWSGGDGAWRAFWPTYFAGLLLRAPNRIYRYATCVLALVRGPGSESRLRGDALAAVLTAAGGASNIVLLTFLGLLCA